MRVAVKTEAIQTELARRGITQAQLARMVQAQESTISRMLRGLKEPRTSLRNRLMQTLNLRFDDLFEIVSESRQHAEASR